MPKWERAHKTRSKQNFAKLCTWKFSLETSYQVGKVSARSIIEKRKFRDFLSAETGGVIKIKL